MSGGILTIDLDATGVKTSGDQATTTIKGVGDAAVTTGGAVDQLGQKLNQQGSAFKAAADQFDMAEKSLRRMGLTSEQIASALTHMGFDQARSRAAAFGEQVDQATQSLKAHAVAQETVATGAAGTTLHFGRLGYSMESLAARTLGVNHIFGQLSGTMLAMGEGTGIMIAVMAGVTALGLAYEAIAGHAGEAAKAIDGVIAKLAQQYDAMVKNANFDQIVAQGKVTALLKQIADARAVADAPALALTGPNVAAVEADSQKRALAMKEEERLTMQLIQANKALVIAHIEVGDSATKTHEEQVAALIKIIDLHKQSSTDEALRRRFIAQDGEALKALHGTESETLLERSRLQTEINALIEAGTTKTRAHTSAVNEYAASLIRVRREGGGSLADPIGPSGTFGALTPETIKAFDEADRRVKLLAEQHRRDDAERLRILNEGIKELKIDAGNIGNAIADQLFGTPEQIKQAKERAKRATHEVQAGIAKAFDEIALHGVAGFATVFTTLEQYAVKAAAGIAAAFTVESLGIDKFFKELTSKNGSLQSALGQLTPGGRAALGGLAGGAIGSFVGSFVGSQTGDAAAGAIPGAAFGAAAGALTGPLGALAGGIAGFVSGLLSGSAAAKQAAEQMRLATEAFNSDLGKLIDVANPRGALGTALQGLTDQFTKLVEEAAKASGVTLGGQAADFAGETVAGLQSHLAAVPADNGSFMDSINDKLRTFWEDLLKSKIALDAANKAIEEQTLLQRRYATEDLNVRLLRAQGDTAGADAQAFANTQQREWQAALDKYAQSATPAETAANGLYLTNLQITQAAEQEKFVKDQLLIVQNKLNAAIATGLSLDAQIAGAKAQTPGQSPGQARASADATAQATYNASIFTTMDQFRQGLIDITTESKQATLAGIVLNNSLANNALAFDAATNAVKDYNAATTAAANQSGQQSGISIAGANAAKDVMAHGGTMDAALKAADLATKAAQVQYDSAVRNAAHQKALDDAVKSGANATTIAAIVSANHLDDLAVAANDYLTTLKAQNEAAKVNAALLAAENASKEDLGVRLLRAQGFTNEADSMQKRINDDRELQKYKDLGYNADFIKFAKVVFAAEEGKLASDQAKAAQQTVASASAAGASSGSLSFANVQTITQAQGDMLTSIGLGQLAALNELVRMGGGRIAGIGATGANGAPLGISVAVIDTTMSHQASVHSTANGNTVPV